MAKKQPSYKNHNSPLRFLMVLYYFHPYTSGVSVYALKLAKGLIANGHEVTVLTSRHEKSLPSEEILDGIRIVRRPVLFKLDKGVIMPTFWLDVIRYSKKHDIVNPHLPMPDTGFSSLFIPKRKIVTTYQCDISLQSGLIGKVIVGISFAMMHLQLARSKAIATLSKDYFVHSKMKRYAEKAQQIYPAIFASEFKRVDSSALEKKLGLNEKTVKIGFMGRIVYEKGINYLLETIPPLVKRGYDFKIIIAGDYENIAGGSIKDQLESHIENYPDKIVFTGYLPEEEKAQFYSMLDVFVLPSIDPLEAFGIVQVEAMLCGSPVVASDLPGVREVVNNTGFGLVSKARDSKSIAKCIIEIVDNKQKYTPLRDKVMSTFNPKDTVRAYEKLARLD